MSAAANVNRWLLPGLCIVILLVGWGARVVDAQNATDVRTELNKTDLVLLRAKRLVIDENCPSQRARDLLVQARDIQEQAWGAFGNGLHRAALKSTQMARNLAIEAIKIAERWQFVKGHIQKTSDLIELATEMVTANPQPQAAALLETALGQFERSKDALRSGQIEQAFHLLKNANKLAQNIIDMLENQGIGRDRVVRELERTDHLIDKAKPSIEESGDEKAQALLERGVQTQNKAWELFRQARFQSAHGLTIQARELVAKAWVMVEGPISPEQISQAITATDDLIARVRPLIMESQNRDAIDVFLTAENHQEKAKVAFMDRRFKIALAQTKIARRLVERALDMVGEG